MGDWLDGFKNQVEELKGHFWVRSQTWTYGMLTAPQVPGNASGRALAPRKDYVEIRLKSMRIPFERVGGRRYYGTVHSFITLNSLAGSGEASFNVVTTPGQLQKVDPNNLSNVVQTDIPLLGPVPYLGGDVKLEAGVFSVLAQDLIAPFLKVVENISNTAGVSIVSQALPFVQPLENAVYELIGASDTNKLEIGIKTPIREEGYLAVVGDSSVPLAGLKLGQDGKLYNGTAEVSAPYMVLSIKALKTRDDYTKIPDVLKALQELLVGIRSGSTESINQFYQSFARTTRGSPDLLPMDAESIIQQTYEERVKPALAAADVRSYTKEMRIRGDDEDAAYLLKKIDASIKQKS
jgi:hypothetical protein